VKNEEDEENCRENEEDKDESTRISKKICEELKNNAEIFSKINEENEKWNHNKLCS